MSIKKRTNKIISVFITLVIIINLFSFTSYAIIFPDTSGHWASGAIDKITDLGIMTYSSNFNPSGYYTRKEVAYSLCMFFKENNLPSSPHPFYDVSTSDYYSKYIKWVYDAGVMSGTATNTFSPNLYISRQDLCVAMYQLYFYRLGIPYYSFYSQSTFADDSSIASYAKNAVYALQRIGVVSGSTGGNFNPTNYATKAEIACMLYALQNYGFILSTPQQQQLMTNWCWAANAKILAEYRYNGSRTQTEIANYINGGVNEPRSIYDVDNGATWATYYTIQHNATGVCEAWDLINEISYYRPLSLLNGFYDESSNWFGHFMICLGYVKNPFNTNESKLFIYDVGDNSYFWVSYNEYLYGYGSTSTLQNKVVGKTYVHTIYSY